MSKILETMGLEPISLTCKVNILPTKLYPHIFFFFLKLTVILNNFLFLIEKLEEDRVKRLKAVFLERVRAKVRVKL